MSSFHQLKESENVSEKLIGSIKYPMGQRTKMTSGSTSQKKKMKQKICCFGSSRVCHPTRTKRFGSPFSGFWDPPCYDVLTVSWEHLSKKWNDLADDTVRHGSFTEILDFGWQIFCTSPTIDDTQKKGTRNRDFFFSFLLHTFSPVLIYVCAVCGVCVCVLDFNSRSKARCMNGVCAGV